MDFPIELPPGFIQKAASLGVKPEDIDEQFIRGSGAGGQKINKTNSAVLLHHRPSDLTVRCQKYREQGKNRLSGWKLLILKIEQQVKGKESSLAQKAFKLKKQKTRRSRKAKQKMLQDKHHRSEIKEMRKLIKGF